MRTKMVFTAFTSVAVVSLIFNVVMWNNLKSQKKQYNDLLYNQATMNLRSELKAAAGNLDAPNPDFAYVSTFVHGASNDLGILNDPFSERGIPHAAEISVKLANIESDYEYSSRVTEKNINNDKVYIEKVYSIYENTCYPNGQIKESAFPMAFAQMYSVSQ